MSGVPSEIFRLDPAQLAGTGARTPATTLITTSAALATLTAVAFADDGTLWMASPDDSLVLAFTPDLLAASGRHAATTMIESADGSLRAPAGLAFDDAHGLWVANHQAGTLVRFDPDQLATGGALEPVVVISGVAHPTGLAFDSDGGLWVSDNVANTLARFDRRQLATSGSKTPDAAIAGVDGCFVNPSGLAFDVSGSLWVANLGCNNVVAFDPEQLRESGTRSPAAEVSADPGFVLPAALAFDAAGSLWVLGASGILTQLARSSLDSGGSATPVARLELPGHNLLWSFALWPKPSGLPLR